MSFLYEPELLNKFTKILNKKAQDFHVPKLISLRDKLVNRLDNNINVSDSATKVFSDPGAKLTYNALGSLNEFIKFLYVNRINFMNHDIVSSNNEDNSLERVEYYLENTPVYVHKDTLSNYLNYLARAAENNKDKKMGSLINKLMSDSRSLVNKGSLESAKVHYEDEFHEGLKLTDVPLNVFSSNETGIVDLKIGDLKDKYSFNSWLKKSFKNIDNVYENISQGINYIFNVLVKKYNQASTKFNGELFENAIKRLNDLAKTFNVQLNGNIKTKQEKQNNNLNASELARLMHKIGLSLPLNDTNIDINRITKFFDNIIELDPEYNKFKQEALNSLKLASRISGLQTFPLNVDYSHILSTIKEPNKNINGLFYYIDTLLNGLVSVYNAMEHFRNSQKSRLSKNLINKFNSQIGNSPTDYSVYKNNVFTLQNIKNKAKDNIHTTQK